MMTERITTILYTTKISNKNQTYINSLRKGIYLLELFQVPKYLMQRYLIPIQNCNKYFVFLIFFIRFVKIEKNDELNEVIFQYCKQEEVFCMCRIIIKLHKLGYLAKSESYMLQGRRTDNVLESSRFYNKTKIKNK